MHNVSFPIAGAVIVATNAAFVAAVVASVAVEVLFVVDRHISSVVARVITLLTLLLFY